MRIRVNAIAAACLIVFASHAHAQALPLPASRAAVPAYDAEMVRRIAKLLDSPTRWNRAESGGCLAGATTFSIQCALQSVTDSAAAAQAAGHTGPSTCRFQRTSVGMEGSCGMLFMELPIFTVAHVVAVTSGKWRDDAAPVAVWSGVMTDAAAPVRMEARRTIDAITTKKYAARLVGFNNDSATTFAVLQNYLKILGDRVSDHALADFAEDGDSVEVEIYAGGSGVIRTHDGWYPVTNFSATNDEVQFQMDPAKQVAPNALDKRIIQRAAEILSAESVWNRADDRKCPASAKTWSIYCAVQKASAEVTGGFHHRRPAGELVRVVVEERTKDKNYEHRMMDYNNDKSTTRILHHFRGH
jgi:hypothetical protein